MTEKQKRIADLKKQLLAPIPKRNRKLPAADKGEENDMHNKFKRVMDHGTPRLVTKNAQFRQINFNNTNSASRSQLLQIANIRTGPLPSKLEQKGPN